MLYRLFNNKYVFFAESFVNNTKRYGIKAAFTKMKREKNTSCEILKKDFAENEYCRKVFELIEKRIGKKMFIDDFSDFGYCVIAPVIYEYIKELADKSRAYDEIWFLAREGWLLKSVFDIYAKKNGFGTKSRYFLASRRAASVAAVKCEEDIKTILSGNYNGGVKNLFRARLGKELNCEDFKVSLPEDIEKVMKLADVQDIIAQSRIENKNYKAYIGDVKNVVVADVGYQGTIQYYLSKITDKRVDGFYICSHYKNKLLKTDCRCDSLFPVINMREELTNPVFKNQLYFEAVLKAPFGQLLCFDDNAQPIYNDENDYDENVREIQNGILRFAEDFDFESYKKSTFTAELCDTLIRNNTSEDILKALVVEDRYCSDTNLSAKKGQ